jgi:hypothetical protein
MNTTQEQTKSATLTVYDPAMCCSTGVCGPDVDDELVDFANDVKWLKSQGVRVNRHNLGQEPEAFKTNPEVISRLKTDGSDILPIITVDGSIVSEGGYPDRDQLSDWLGLSTNGASESSNEKQRLLNGLRQSVIEGEIDQMRTQFQLGAQAGIAQQELVNTMQDGINERQQRTRQVVEAANELIGVQTNGCAPGSGCC